MILFFFLSNIFSVLRLKNEHQVLKFWDINNYYYETLITNHFDDVEHRGELLQQYFPRTFAKIAELLRQ